MDAALLTLLAGWQDPRWTALFGAVTWLGSLAVLLPLALLIAWRSALAAGWRRWQAWGFMPAAVGGAALIAHLLKITIDRARPDLFPPLVTLPADASFPSAHSMQVTAFVLAWLLVSANIRRPGPVCAGLMLILTVGLSRIYLQVHFPGDVLFGILFGALWVLALRALPAWRARMF